MFINRMIEEKARWRRYKNRVDALPEDHRRAAKALERYFMYFAPDKGDELMVMLEDLIDLFEESAANGTSIRDIVGEDPVTFAEEFRNNYPLGNWIVKERTRLSRVITEIEAQQPESGDDR